MTFSVLKLYCYLDLRKKCKKGSACFKLQLSTLTTWKKKASSLKELENI